MKITYREMDFDSKEDLLLLCQWYNDPTITSLFNLYQSEEETHHTFTAADFLPRRQPPTTMTPFANLLILADGVPIGEARFEVDTRKLHTQQPNTGWISLVIGVPAYRGQGLGAGVVSHLEERLAALGVERVEVGIFEYNSPSLRLFSRLGYEEISRREGRVWWRGQMWAEIRYLKPLSQ